MHWRNNLFLGENSGPAIFSVNTFTNYTSSDYNGFRPNPGAAVSFRWNSPPFAVADGSWPGPVADDQRSKRASSPSLADYSKATGQDRNSVLVDYDVFVNVPAARRAGFATVQKLYKAEDFDFRLKPGAAAVDRGRRAATITDGFAGARPISARSRWGRHLTTMGHGNRPRAPSMTRRGHGISVYARCHDQERQLSATDGCYARPFSDDIFVLNAEVDFADNEFFSTGTPKRLANCDWDKPRRNQNSRTPFGPAAGACRVIVVITMTSIPDDSHEVFQ